MEGWIKLSRTIINHWIYKDDRYFKAWIRMIMTVNYEPKKILISGELIDCGRGQSLLSIKNWAELFGKGWSVQRVRTFFNLLKNDEVINIEGLRKTTRLTICNYDKYQNGQRGDNEENNEENNEEITRRTTTTKEERNKEERIKKKERIERNSNFFFSEEELENSKPEEGISLPDPEEKVKEMNDFMKMLMEEQ